MYGLHRSGFGSVASADRSCMHGMQPNALDNRLKAGDTRTFKIKDGQTERLWLARFGERYSVLHCWVGRSNIATVPSFVIFRVVRPKGEPEDGIC